MPYRLKYSVRQNTLLAERMKIFATICLFALILNSAVRATNAKTEVLLFSHDDYRFAVTTCEAEPAEKKEKRRVLLTISCQVPEHVRFILFAAKSPAGSLADSLAYRVIESSPKHAVTIAFEVEAESSSFFLGLWRGVGGDSPSGIVCDGAVVSLPLKNTPVFRHE